jgi:hypothetical protein
MSLSFEFGVKAFGGEGITYLGGGQYLVEREDGQLEFIDPSIEIYKMRDAVTAMDDDGKKDVFCPNTKTLKHPKNQWGATDVEMVYHCNQCNAKLDIRTNKNIVEIGEAK